MDKNAIKKYAVWARRELTTRVAGRAAQYGVTEDGWGNADADSVEGRVLSDTEKKQRVAFIDKVRAEGYEQAVEEVAYTWFNRFCALRYMEVNAYLPSHIHVFTNDVGEFKPQILDEALHLDLDGLNMDKVLKLKEDANQTEELFRYLLITQCNALSSILPGMFQKIEDYTELLLPENLLREGSVIERLIMEIPEEDWTDQVQIIGWLYQYYNAEKKDEVFAALKKNVKITKENIPAATQLFTPDWIVRYMVENSLGRLWIEGHPNEQLKSGWKYYLDEAEQKPEVEAQLVEIRKEYATLKPEDIKCIDPCCGSGHILVYMFDVLMQIYECYGYTTQETVSSIVENNLFGLDIDDRAAQLAYFSVMMKARSYDRRFFSRSIQPHVYAIREATKADYEYLEMFGSHSDTVKKLLDSFINAKEYGSLIDPKISMEELLALGKHMGEMDEMSDYGSLNSQLFTYMALNSVWPFLKIAKLLIQKYDVVVTNPPYMSSTGMNTKLQKFAKKNYANYKSDLYALFIKRCSLIIKKYGFYSMITQHTWMFLSRFEKMRQDFSSLFVNMAHLGAHAFEDIGGEVVQTVAFVCSNIQVDDYLGIYIRLVECNNELGKENAFFKNELRFFAKQNDYMALPGKPIAYWASEKELNAFQIGTPLAMIAEPRVGIITGNNDKFIHYWWEVNNNDVNTSIKNFDESCYSSSKWYPYNKGGSARLWYGNRELVVLFRHGGSDIKINAKNTGCFYFLGAQDVFFHEGITWNGLASNRNTFRFSPEGTLFDSNKGPMLFPDDALNRNYLLGLFNSKVTQRFLSILNPSISLQAGDFEKLPVLYSNNMELPGEITEECIFLSKIDWDSFEISWDFQRHPFVCPGSTIAEIYAVWENECNFRFNRLKDNEKELNRIFIDIYNLQDELTPDVADENITICKADLQRDIKSLISYAVGCMFGRYSLDVDGLAYAGGEWDASKYRTYMPDYNGILPICDDEYFTDDIVGHFVDFIRTVYGQDSLEENLQFIADALGGKGSARETIRKYFLNDFYADHCKIYQKRPIYWLFDSGKKNGFKCLIYLHRYRPDTIARIRTDYVHEQQARYRTAIADLENRINGSSTSEGIKLNRALKKLQDQAEELLGFEEKIHHLADQFIEMDLDDGVKVNYVKFQDVLAKIK